MTRRVVIVVLLCALAAPTTALGGNVVKTPPIAMFVPAPPDAPCDSDHIGDVYIIRGHWFECSCEARVYTEDTCDWYEITSPAADPQALRKLIKRTKKITRIKGGLLYTPRVRPVIA